MTANAATLARWPFGRRPASVAGGASAGWKWRSRPSARNSSRTGWRICAAAPRFCPAGWARRAIWMFSRPSSWTRPPKTGEQRSFRSACARARKRCATRPGKRPATASPAPISRSSPMMSRPWPSRACRWRRDTKLPRVARAHCSTASIRRVAKARPQGRASREEGDLHRLRIALKKLRYTAEFLAPLYPRKQSQALSARSCAAAGTSGRHQRYRPCPRHHGQLLRETDGKQADAGRCAMPRALVAGWYRARRPQLVKQALKRWKKFRKVKPFWA